MSFLGNELSVLFSMEKELCTCYCVVTLQALKKFL